MMCWERQLTGRQRHPWSRGEHHLGQCHGGQRHPYIQCDFPINANNWPGFQTDALVESVLDSILQTAAVVVVVVVVVVVIVVVALVSSLEVVTSTESDDATAGADSLKVASALVVVTYLFSLLSL